MISMPVVSSGTPTVSGADSPERVRDAAQQFEALLLTGLLKSARESDRVFQGDDSSGDAVFEMAEQQFAQALAQSGGMGLARLITSGLHVGKPSDK